MEKRGLPECFRQIPVAQTVECTKLGRGPSTGFLNTRAKWLEVAKPTCWAWYKCGGKGSYSRYFGYVKISKRQSC